MKIENLIKRKRLSPYVIFHPEVLIESEIAITFRYRNNIILERIRYAMICNWDIKNFNKKEFSFVIDKYPVAVVYEKIKENLIVTELRVFYRKFFLNDQKILSLI